VPNHDPLAVLRSHLKQAEPDSKRPLSQVWMHFAPTTTLTRLLISCVSCLQISLCLSHSFHSFAAFVLLHTHCRSSVYVGSSRSPYDRFPSAARTSLHIPGPTLHSLRQQTMDGGNKILWAFIGFEILFLGCAVLHLVIPLTTHASLGRVPTFDNVAGDLLLDHCPLTGMSHSTVPVATVTNRSYSFSGQLNPDVCRLPHVPPGHVH
jgi:hypothetical protein